MPLLQERARTLAELPQLGDFLFFDDIEYDANLLLSSGLDARSAIQAIELVLQSLETTKTWDVSLLEAVLRPLAAELNLSTRKFFGLLRVATTGRTAAPPLFQTMVALGKDKCLKRLTSALQRMAAL